MPPDSRSPLAGRYRLDTVLGDGGMGRVWQGYDETLGRRVAVKEVRFPPDISEQDQRSLSERTMREARLTAQLNHPAVVTTYDAVIEDGRPFIVMELVPSVSLAEHLGSHGPLTAERTAAIGVTLLDALTMAHGHGIVHRDVKPSNVLLGDDGRVHLSDFGIATRDSDPSLTTSGVLVGSPAYMSPERLRGLRSGPPADAWSLGATLYAALEGRPPFLSETTMGTITAILNDEVTPPRVHGPLTDAVMGLLVKDPERRLTLEQARPLLARASQGRGPEGTSRFGAAAPPAVAARDAERDPDPAPAPPPTASDTGPDTPPDTGPDTGPDTPPDTGPHTGPDTGPVRPAARRRAPAVLAAVTAVVVAAMGAAAFMLLDEPDPKPAAPQAGADRAPRTPAPSPEPSGETTSSPSPTKTQQSSPAPRSTPPARSAPEGYTMKQDPLGFQVAVPQGWQRRLDAEKRVDYVSPDGSRFLRIDQRAQALPDAEKAWRDAEPAVSEQLDGYQRIRIRSVPHPRWDVADWEFTWQTDSGRTLHVLNRGIATDTRGFALYMSAPHDSWSTEGQPVFDVAATTFRPTS